jgi:hypothetical protein
MRFRVRRTSHLMSEDSPCKEAFRARTYEWYEEAPEGEHRYHVVPGSGICDKPILDWCVDLEEMTDLMTFGETHGRVILTMPPPGSWAAPILEIYDGSRE